MKMLSKRTVHTILEDIKTNPSQHKHSFDELQKCCMIGGALDLIVMEAHEGLLGYNGGVACDVTEGPCACGAFH